MVYLADTALAIGAMLVAVYCLILSRRLKKFSDTDQGVGGAIAVLTKKIDELTGALDAAQVAASDSTNDLIELTGKAENTARHLELLLAAMPETSNLTAPPPSYVAAPRDAATSGNSSRRFIRKQQSQPTW